MCRSENTDDVTDTSMICENNILCNLNTTRNSAANQNVVETLENHILAVIHGSFIETKRWCNQVTVFNQRTIFLVKALNSFEQVQARRIGHSVLILQIFFVQRVEVVTYEQAYSVPVSTKCCRRNSSCSDDVTAATVALSCWHDSVAFDQLTRDALAAYWTPFNVFSSSQSIPAHSSMYTGTCTCTCIQVCLCSIFQVSALTM